MHAAFDTRDRRGLIATIKVARTQRGDDTLGLAFEQMLSASVGFAVPDGGEILNRFARTRRITHAQLDHLALVQAAAYSDAKILAVRATPRLDSYRHDRVLAWASYRCDPVSVWARNRLNTRR